MTAEKPIQICLDDLDLEVKPIARSRPEDETICTFQGQITFPSGEKVNTGFRYDQSKQNLIDPLVQYNILKQRGEVDYQVWERYRSTTSGILTRKINDGSIQIQVALEGVKLEDFYELKGLAEASINDKTRALKKVFEGHSTTMEQNGQYAPASILEAYESMYRTIFEGLGDDFRTGFPDHKPE